MVATFRPQKKVIGKISPDLRMITAGNFDTTCYVYL
jgi:hypothetical protein